MLSGRGGLGGLLAMTPNNGLAIRLPLGHQAFTGLSGGHWAARPSLSCQAFTGPSKVTGPPGLIGLQASLVLKASFGCESFLGEAQFLLCATQFLLGVAQFFTG